MQQSSGACGPHICGDMKLVYFCNMNFTLWKSVLAPLNPAQTNGLHKTTEGGESPVDESSEPFQPPGAGPCPHFNQEHDLNCVALMATRGQHLELHKREFMDSGSYFKVILNKAC